MAEFEPKILAFCCNWCSYAGADLAGVSRLQYPPNIRIIRVMCSGRVEPEFVVKALSLRADGVLILGCHIGDCHYIYGNHRTKKRMAILERILGYLGIDPARVRLEWVSASEGARFAEVVRQFTEEIKKLGPNPLKEVRA
ncbi:MAG: methyl-viologen-reducing hydrogenase subunit delta [Chloroflexi bacterium CG_4_9_14_3_um_filter_45_9]|nr:MAG: methyl-viologen-reducing hydrogenase subunit delta [Dehalococcoidia bacterium CG2_30_46_9]PJB48455.1 MAG: methyl-viologen-reducing hydrogenase subunit delta [Chloroflexi bacterium CG_4_9_14_3_um_filter_45_9]